MLKNLSSINILDFHINMWVLIVIMVLILSIFLIILFFSTFLWINTKLNVEIKKNIAKIKKSSDIDELIFKIEKQLTVCNNLYLQTVFVNLENNEDENDNLII